MFALANLFRRRQSDHAAFGWEKGSRKINLIQEWVIVWMSDQHRMFELLEEYRQARESANLPVKLRLYFTTLEEMLHKHYHADPTRQHIVDPAFATVFQKLTELERAAFLHWMLTRTVKHFGPAKSNSNVEGTGDGAIGNVETSCKMESVSFGLTSWNKARFRLDKFARSVNVVSKQRNILLNLEDFLLRRSRRHKHTLVLEAISKRVPPEHAKLTLYFADSIFKEIQKEVHECVLESHKARVLQLEGVSEDVGIKADKCLVFLGSEEITAFLKYKGLVLERLAQDNLHFKLIFGKEGQVQVFRSAKVSKLFKLEFHSHLTGGELKVAVTDAFRCKFRFRVEETVMEEFSKRYQAVYQKYLFSGQIYDQINLRQEGVSDREDVYFSKGVDNALTPNTIEFVLIRVLPTSNGSICRVYSSLSVSKDVPEQLLVSFMLEFNEMLQRGKQAQLMMEQTQQQQFFSIVSSDPKENDMSVEIEPEMPESSRSTKATEDIKNQDEWKEKELWAQKKLCRISIVPLDLTAEALQALRQKQHMMFKEWKRAKDGGLVCCDAELIAEQKKMIKKIIASIGNSIFKIIRSGSGFMNMCLPVAIFKRESHLQSIARNFSYAPLILDGWQQADPLERFKSCVMFAVSNCTLSISMKKPFNPILGETYQSWVGGCPLYLEQLSHHPPISAYYFCGRGYTLHGNIEAKISISGLNGGKCWSEKPTFIDFADGTRVSLVFAKMVIKNVIIGEREFHFTDKIFIYDMKNNYFAELFFGPRKKGFLGATSDPEDLIHGHIYRTTTAFLGKFKGKPIGVYPGKEDIAKEICSIEGVWNETVRFDGKEYIDFRKFLPYEMEEESNPLPSNSLYRPDLLYVSKNMMDLAQEHKEKLENLQRHDRKLRESHTNK